MKEKTPAEKDEVESLGTRIVGLFRMILIYGLAIAIIGGAVLFATNQNPNKSLFGYRYYTVLTPSMTPTYKVGDLVFVKLCHADAVSVGDVITFHPSRDGDAYLTHRVVEKHDNYQGTNLTAFRTKGDANESADSFLIDEERLIGTVEFHIPKVGYIIRFIQLRWYFVVPLIVMLFVFFELLDRYFEGEEDTVDETAEEAEEKPDSDASHEQE